MKKKTIIILSSLAALCIMGLVASHFIDWPIDLDSTSGDIAKSARFSRKQASEKITNMEELLKTDSAYKDGIVTAYVVMQTRAMQFGALVDMTNEAAGNIPELAEVLKDMNEARELVNNVNASLSAAGEDLNAALSGEDCPDLTQNTINASLAYTILQKQNTLADRFIEATDKYLATAKGDDRLKLVRDQWVDYQTMTAALENDTKSAEALAQKGCLLSAEKTLAAMETFQNANVVPVVASCKMSQDLGVATSLSNAFPANALANVGFGTLIAAAAQAQMQNSTSTNLQSNLNIADLCNAAKQALANGAQQTLANGAQQTLANGAQQSLANGAQQTLANGAQQTLANGAQQSLANGAQQTLANGAQQSLANGAKQALANGAQQSLANGAQQALANGALQTLANQAQQSLANGASSFLRNSQQNLCNQLNEIISATAVGNRPDISNNIQ